MPFTAVFHYILRFLSTKTFSMFLFYSTRHIEDIHIKYYFLFRFQTLENSGQCEYTIFFSVDNNI